MDEVAVKSTQRRSQRSLLVMPLAVTWTTNTGMRVREHAETEVVSSTGGLLRMRTRLPTQGRVELKRPATNQSSPVRIVTISEPGPDGWYRIAVEFLTPVIGFWGINFPPLNNKPHHLPRPRSEEPTLAALMASRISSDMWQAGLDAK